MPVWNGYTRVSAPSVSVFDTASTEFDLSVSGPEPLAIEGWLFDGFPRRPVPLDEVGRRLLGRRCPAAVKDAVWAHLVRRSRAEGGAWTVGCVGLALPGLIIRAKKLAGWAPDPADVHASVLTGFLTGLADLDLDRPWVLNRLMQAARRAGERAVREELSAPIPVEEGFESRQPPAPWGHSDLLLADAVTDGVITREQADMIGVTRLEDVSARAYAAAHGISYDTFLRTRLRAEGRLVAWLKEGTTAEALDRAADVTRSSAERTDDHGAGRGDHHPGSGGSAAAAARGTARDAVARPPEGSDEQIVARVVAVTGRSRAWVRAALRTASTAPVPAGSSVRQAARRPGGGRPSARPQPLRSSRAVTGSGRGAVAKPRRRVSENGDLQPN
jgi:hypothetical protein